jgi:hypothetical protein
MLIASCFSLKRVAAASATTDKMYNVTVAVGYSPTLHLHLSSEGHKFMMVEQKVNMDDCIALRAAWSE